MAAAAYRRSAISVMRLALFLEVGSRGLGRLGCGEIKPGRDKVMLRHLGPVFPVSGTRHQTSWPGSRVRSSEVLCLLSLLGFAPQACWHWMRSKSSVAAQPKSFLSSFVQGDYPMFQNYYILFSHQTRTSSSADH